MNIFFRCIKPAILISIILARFANSQVPDTTWTKVYGGINYDRGYSASQTTDRGYILGAYTASFGNGGDDIWLIKTNPAGYTIWARVYGGNDNDRCCSVQQTADGGYVVAGETQSFGAGSMDMYLIKTDSVGDTLWTKTYGGPGAEQCHSMQQTSDGGYILGGDLLIKVDSLGNVVWTKSFAGDIWSVQQTVDGGYIACGMTSTTPRDILLARVNENGDTVWTKAYGGSSFDDVYLIKTDSNGDTVWTKTHGGSFEDMARSVQQTPDGGFIVVGQTESFGSGMYDVWLLRIDIDGDTLWTRTYGGGDYDSGTSVQRTDDYGYIIAGYTNSFGAGYSDVWLLKIGRDEYAAYENKKIDIEKIGMEIYPNPFRIKTNIRFPMTLDSKIGIYDIAGNLIKQFDNSVDDRENVISWCGEDNKGGIVPNGIYFVKLQSLSHTEIRKLVFMRDEN